MKFGLVEVKVKMSELKQFLLDANATRWRSCFFLSLLLDDITSSAHTENSSPFQSVWGAFCGCEAILGWET